MIFDYKDTDSGSGITGKMFDNLFPIGITKTERLLTIVEKRSYGNIITWLFVIFFVLIAGYLLSNGIWKFYGMIYVILIALACLAIIGYAVKKILEAPYKRISIFDKEQSLYKIAGITLLKNIETIGKLDEIKKVNVRVTRYEDSDNNISYSYYAYLQLDDFLAYHDSNMVQLQEAGGQLKAAEIAGTVASFLNLPFPEETGDISENSGSGFMEDLSILK